jgi:hypothetical protein
LDEHPEYRVEYRGVVNDEQIEQREALLDFGLGVAAASQSIGVKDGVKLVGKQNRRCCEPEGADKEG